MLLILDPSSYNRNGRKKFFKIKTNKKLLKNFEGTRTAVRHLTIVHGRGRNFRKTKIIISHK
nr:unnamed protein product [Callosobruchus chinensis]